MRKDRNISLSQGGMPDYIALFMNYIRTEKRYSALTLQAYGRDIDRLLEFLRVQPEAFDPAFLTPEDIRAWIVDLSEVKGLKPASINRMICSVRAMYRYFHREGFVDRNLFLHIGFLKTPAALPVYIPEGKMHRIVEGLRGDGTEGNFLVRRNALIILLFYSTGIRLAELIAINRTDINETMTELRVRGKGDKQRIVPLVGTLHRYISSYTEAIIEENICVCEEKALFLTEQGKRISRGEVYRIVRNGLIESGVQGKCSPHVLRHTFATHMLNNGADMREIQELLGHASLRATQIYTHNSVARLKEIYKEAHPRAQHKK